MPKFQHLVLWSEKQRGFQASLTCVSMGGLFSGVRPLKRAGLGAPHALITFYFALKSISHVKFALFKTFTHILH